MKLKDENIDLKDILLDENNPRFMIKPGSSQDEIIRKILSSKESKALLNSMKHDIRWVNRIVVRPLEDGTYIAVEGNTRLACLKSGKIDGWNDNTKVPVLIATIEVGETLEEFERAIRITQGIANVMVVKEWPAVSKARHLYGMFKSAKAVEPEKRETDIVRAISESLGTTIKEVRDAVKRFVFYKEIEKEADTLGDNQWSYLEGVTKNDATRKFFGFNDSVYDFEWNLKDDDSDSDELDIKRERLNFIPDIIKMPGITAQSFREKLPILISGEHPDDLLNELVNEDRTWIDITNGESKDSKEIGMGRLREALNIIETFTPAEEWAIDEDVTDIMKKMERKIKFQIQCIERINTVDEE